MRLGMIKPKRIEKIWWKVRKVKYKRGYSIHSPFVYNLITTVVRERDAYYCYDEVDKLLRTLYASYQKKSDFVICRRILSAKKQTKYARFLFRLVNYLQPCNVLELGPSIGLNTLYMALPYADTNCTLITSEPDMLLLADRLLKGYEVDNVTLREEAWSLALDRYLQANTSIDLIYCILAPSFSLEEIYDKCKHSMHAQSVFVVQGIRANEKNRQAWETIKRDKDVIVSIDMYSMGILFYDQTLTPKDYTLYF